MPLRLLCPFADQPLWQRIDMFHHRAQPLLVFLDIAEIAAAAQQQRLGQNRLGPPVRLLDRSSQLLMVARAWSL